MELKDAIRKRRMIRQYDPDRQVPPEVLAEIAKLSLRAPSAGFSQGWDFVVLQGAERDPFWAAMASENWPGSWLAGVRNAPTLVVCLSDKSTYLKRYQEKDKPFQDGEEKHWPVFYWDVDTGMAAMLMLLLAVDADLGALFFGVQVEDLPAVRSALAIPEDRNIVGVVALGYSAEEKPTGSPRKRARRGVDEVFHSGRFGEPFTPAS